MDTKFLIDTADFINQNLKEITGGESTQDKKEEKKGEILYFLNIKQ